MTLEGINLQGTETVIMVLGYKLSCFLERRIKKLFSYKNQDIKNTTFLL